MDIMRNGSQPAKKGPSDWFTGTVRIDSPFQRNAPARVGGAIVTFEPGARTAWHTHPLGQTLIVVAGCGRAQREGGPIEEIRAGDFIWLEPGEKHSGGLRGARGSFCGCSGGLGGDGVGKCGGAEVAPSRGYGVAVVRVWGGGASGMRWVPGGVSWGFKGGRKISRRPRPGLEGRRGLGGDHGIRCKCAARGRRSWQAGPMGQRRGALRAG